MAVLTQLVMEGGPDLLDELCLAAYCRAGDYITTRGYLLPAHCGFNPPSPEISSCMSFLLSLAAVYHCVFGNLEENLRHCIWQALDNGSTGERATIAFWLDGFSAVNGIYKLTVREMYNKDCKSNYPPHLCVIFVIVGNC